MTVAQAARALGVSPSTVRRDVQRGCAGIVRPGESGRGRGALLDLDLYRSWRDGRHDDEHVLGVVADVLTRIVREHGGLTIAVRRHSAFIAISAYVRIHQAVLRRDIEALPAELRAACAVLSESPQRSR